VFDVSFFCQKKLLLLDATHLSSGTALFLTGHMPPAPITMKMGKEAF
jgi:hypothetical protein